MDYEKLYKDALKKVSELYREYNNVSNMIDVKEELETIFPELKESEDEKIRKWIIDDIRYNMNNEPLNNSEYKKKAEKAIAWLEKQGEQKVNSTTLVETGNGGINALVTSELPIISDSNYCSDCINKKGCINCENGDMKETEHKVESKFHEGDWIIHQGTENIYQVIARIDNQYQLKYGDNYTIQKCTDVDRCARLWTIQDAKDGDVLCYKDEISLYKHDIKNCDKQETTFGGFVYHCCYDGKKFITDSLYSLTEQDKIDIHPATKEQSDTLFTKIKEVEWKWDAEKKELRKIEQKPANNINLKFKKGDWVVVSTIKGDRVVQIASIEYLKNGYPSYITTDGRWFGNGTNARLLTDKDMEIATIPESKVVVNKIESWNEEDKELYQDALDAFEALANGLNPSEDWGKLYNWLKSIKQRLE